MTELAIRERFIELRGQGLSFASIAEKVGVSKTTLVKWSKQYSADIGNLRQIHTEALRERLRLTSERRLSLFAKQLDLIETELAKRDYKELPTEKLFDMALRIEREAGLTGVPLQLNGFQDISEAIVNGGIEQPVTWEA